MSRSDDGEKVDATGAVRNKLRVRYDLVSPVALGAVSKFYRSGKAAALYNKPISWLLASAQRSVYGFLGYGHEEALPKATACILEALAVEADEPRAWFPDMVHNGLDCIPIAAWRGLAAVYHEGAEKRGAMNWELGMDVPDCLNHLLNHIVDWLDEDDSEPHLAHAAWNGFAAIHSLCLWPALNAGKLRVGFCRAPGASPALSRRTYEPTPIADMIALAAQCGPQYTQQARGPYEGQPYPVAPEIERNRDALARSAEDVNRPLPEQPTTRVFHQSEPAPRKLRLSASTGFKWEPQCDR